MKPVPARAKAIMRSLSAALILAAAIIALSITALPAIEVFNDQGKKIASIPVSDGRFAHHYIHSIHKTPVDEEFEIHGKTLELVRLRYDTYGVGMPSDGGEAFHIEDNRFVVDMTRKFERIDIRVSPIAGHGLVIGGVLHPFTDWVPVESLVTIRAGTRLSMFSRREAPP
jgi:hypothetical protein